MTRDDILRMAREADFLVYDGLGGNVIYTEDYEENLTDQVMRFAALVAAAEREACAKVCEEHYTGYGHAAAIRARGEKP